MQKSFLVKGKVQGVFFRKFTQQKAQELQLQGYVRNQPDGTVFCCAKGSEKSITDLEIFLHSGSPLARVDELIEVENSEEILSSDFQIR